MTVKDFEDFLGEYAERLHDIGADLTPLVNEMVNDLKGRAPVDKGNLKRSIVGAVRGNEVEFGWLDYGTYQNFGVGPDPKSPIKSGRQEPFGITKPIELGPFRYKTRKFGLSAKPWFNVEEMTEDITREIRRLTNNNE